MEEWVEGSKMNKNQFYIYFSLLIFTLIVISNWIITIIKGEIPYVDQWTRDLVESVSGSTIYTMARWITELGSEAFLVPFTVIMGLILLVMFRDWLPALLFAGGTLMSHLLNMW